MLELVAHSILVDFGTSAWPQARSFFSLIVFRANIFFRLPLKPYRSGIWICEVLIKKTAAKSDKCDYIFDEKKGEAKRTFIESAFNPIAVAWVNIVNANGIFWFILSVLCVLHAYADNRKTL